jgi:hypothetical protein
MMKPFFNALVLCPWLALSAWPQTTTPFPPPLSRVQQFLGLTDDQVGAILQNNSDYNDFSSQYQRQTRQAQAQIAVETAKEQLDPMTIGNLYAGIETACRAWRNKATASQQQNISVLTDAQKLKLNALNDAMKLIPTISEAQFGGLLGSAGSPPFSFTTGSAGTFTFDRVISSGDSGCASSFVGSFVFGNIISQTRIAPVATGTSQSGFAGIQSIKSPVDENVR